MTCCTTADWDVIGYPTLRVDTASSRTRIHATIVDAALVARAVGVENAFGSTSAIRITDIIRRADAINGSVLRFALSVGTARVRIARFRWLLQNWFDYSPNVIQNELVLEFFYDKLNLKLMF